MPADFSGKWKLEKSENFDEFLTAMGVNFIKRKAAGAMKPEFEYVQEGDNMTITGGPKVQSFKIGSEFEEDLPNGKKGMAKTNWEGDAFVIEVTGEKNSFKTHREIQGDTLVQTMTFDGITCKRFFKKQ